MAGSRFDHSSEGTVKRFKAPLPLGSMSLCRYADINHSLVFTHGRQGGCKDNPIIPANQLLCRLFRSPNGTVIAQSHERTGEDIISVMRNTLQKFPGTYILQVVGYGISNQFSLVVRQSAGNVDVMRGFLFVLHCCYSL